MAAAIDATLLSFEHVLTGIPGIPEAFLEEVVADAEAFGEAATAVLFFVAIFVGGRLLSHRRGTGAPAKKKLKGAAVAEQPEPAVVEEKVLRPSADGLAIAQERESASLAAMFDSWIARSRREHIATELPAMISNALQSLGMDQAALESRATYLAETVVSACVARGFFGEAVLAYDHVEASFAPALAGSVQLWSDLLGCAVSTGLHSRCGQFWSNLRAQGLPSRGDCANVMTHHAYRRNLSAMSNVLAEMACFCLTLDSETRLAAMSVCVAKGDVELAEAFTVDGICEAALGPPAYQLLVQGHAARGDVERCEELIKEIVASCGAPTEDARGAMLLGLMEGGYVDDASALFQDLRDAGTRLGSAQSVAFVHAAVKAGDLASAVNAMEDYFGAIGSAMSVATQLLMVRAYVANGSIAGAVRVLETLIDQGVVIDDIVSLILSEGCQRLAEPRQLFNTFHWLASHARDSRADAFTSLLKVLCRRRAWAKALELVAFAPKIRLQPTAGDFDQLILDCAGAGALEEAREAYALMISAHRASSSSQCAGAGARLAQACSGHARAAAAVESLRATLIF